MNTASPRIPSPLTGAMIFMLFDDYNVCKLISICLFSLALSFSLCLRLAMNEDAYYYYFFYTQPQ
jgi:hypothetical protein